MDLSSLSLRLWMASDWCDKLCSRHGGRHQKSGQTEQLRYRAEIRPTGYLIRHFFIRQGMTENIMLSNCRTERTRLVRFFLIKFVYLFSSKGIVCCTVPTGEVTRSTFRYAKNLLISACTPNASRGYLPIMCSTNPVLEIYPSSVPKSSQV